MFERDKWYYADGEQYLYDLANNAQLRLSIVKIKMRSKIIEQIANVTKSNSIR